MFSFIVTFVIVICILCDVNYFLKFFFLVASERWYKRKCGLDQTTSIYGLGTFQDCDLRFRSVRLARIIRELDFARYQLYFRTGIYERSVLLNIKSLQGSTLVTDFERIPLFEPYRIDTKLVYWDSRSLFLEHEVIHLREGRVLGRLVSRQYAISESGDSSEALLQGLAGSQAAPPCPEYIAVWLQSMDISSKALRSHKP